MPVFTEYQGPAILFSVTSLIATPVILFFFRQYYRGLDYLQMCYIFGILMANGSFSASLSASMLDFDHSFFKSSCQQGEFACGAGVQLSFLIILVAVLIGAFVFAKFQEKCFERIIVEYQTLYNGLKGFIKWIYLPLTFYSMSFMLFGSNSNSTNPSNLAGSIIVLIIVILFPFAQLAAYKIFPRDDTPDVRIWLEFGMYLRLLATGILCALSIYYNERKYLSCLLIFLAPYTAVSLIFGEFKYKIVERVIFCVGEAAFLILYFIFTYNPQAMIDSNLDFFFFLFVIYMEVTLYIVRGVRKY